MPSVVAYVVHVDFDAVVFDEFDHVVVWPRQELARKRHHNYVECSTTLDRDETADALRAIASAADQRGCDEKHHVMAMWP